MKDFTSILARPHTAEVVERLVRYAQVETTSDRHAAVIPSTTTQWTLARMLETELRALGVNDVSVDEHCFVIGRVPATPGYEKKPTIGLMAHLDTSSEVSGADVHPRVVKNYNGKSLELSPGWVLDPASYGELPDYAGDTIVVTDGTTLLGADDKGGIAVVMTALAAILGKPGATTTATRGPGLPHGPLVIIFSPDEETGKGMDAFPLAGVRMDACYTFDGGRGGEIESECFTAYEAVVTFNGRSAHPGYARGVMANAVSMAASFVAMLPRSESPEATDGWYGYYYAHEIKGGVESARVDVLLRDFTDEGMQKRHKTVRTLASAVEAQFQGGSVTVELRKQYLNMKKKLDESPKVLELLYEAARNAGAEPYSKPIRGGTDGARLTEMGIPTPNVFAGMHNFHGRYEWASASEMVLAVDTTLELVRLWSIR